MAPPFAASGAAALTRVGAEHNIPADASPRARAVAVTDPPETVVALEEPLSGDGASAAAARLREALGTATGGVAIDLAAVRSVDSFGLAALGEAIRRCRREGRSVRVLHPPEGAGRLAAFLRLDRVLEADPAPPARERRGVVERVGDAALRLRDYLVTLLAMTADGYRYAFVDPVRGDPVKWEQFLRQLAEAGAGAVPIVILINFMIGLILAFQMAYVLRDYGATIFIAQVVGISITREIGYMGSGEERRGGAEPGRPGEAGARLIKRTLSTSAANRDYAP
jgi:ABC-type transporter Mla MlaB component